MSFFDEFSETVPEQHRLLARRGDIEVRDYSHYRYLKSGGRSVQGAMCMRTQAVVQSPVVQAMLAAFSLQAPVATVLNLGIGCGAVERYLREHVPAVNLVSVDNNEDVIELARQWFMLPEAALLEHADAAQYLRSNRQHYDLVVCDLALADSQPALINSTPFHRDIQRSLADPGVFVMNLLCDSAQELKHSLLQLRKTFSWTAVYDVPGFDNVVVYASNASPSIGRAWANSDVLSQQREHGEVDRILSASIILP